MIRKTLFTALAVFGLSTGAFASSDAKSSVGIVNFGNCITESKLGKQEQAALESLRTQMTSLLEDSEKQISEIKGKLNDPEYRDGLSPEAEQEMLAKHAKLEEDKLRYQNQFYQLMNQAQMKTMQSVGAQIQEASEKVAKNKKLSVVMNKEACFFHNAALDVTNLVIAEMDKTFDQNNAKVADNQEAALPNAPAKK